MFYNSNRGKSQKAEKAESFGYVELETAQNKAKKVTLTESDIAEMIKRHQKIQSKRKQR